MEFPPAEKSVYIIGVKSGTTKKTQQIVTPRVKKIAAHYKIHRHHPFRIKVIPGIISRSRNSHVATQEL